MKSLSFIIVISLFYSVSFSQIPEKSSEENQTNKIDQNLTTTEPNQEDFDEPYFEEVVIETTESYGSDYPAPPPPPPAPVDTDNKLRCEEVFFIVKKMPEFPGGEQALIKYMDQGGDGTEQRVYVRFIVDCTGHVKSPEVTSSSDPVLSQHAINLVKAMPVWEPGDQNGYKVNVSITIPVIFRN